MTRFIALISGKGGVGKSSSAIALGTALNYLGKDTTIVDANLTTPNIGIYLGAPVVPIHLHHVLQNKNHISEAVYMHPSGTKIVPASISIDDLKKTKSDNLKNAIKGLTGTTDIVLVDCAAGLGKEALDALESVNEVLIITNPEMPAVADALKTIKLAEELNKKVLGVVLTKTKDAKLEMSISNIESLLEKKIISIIPEDKAMKEALMRKESVIYTNPKSGAAISYKQLAAFLLKRKYEEPFEESEKEHFFTRLLKLIGVH
ncbi:cell division ATPase MinD [Candidatus Woesearchaeota archaeon]|nr:cell division ATPase MinD [Candidatus Woesearchaeota archaeon]